MADGTAAAEVMRAGFVDAEEANDWRAEARAEDRGVMRFWVICLSAQSVFTSPQLNRQREGIRSEKERTAERRRAG